MRTKPVLNVDDVKTLLAAAETEAWQNNWEVSIAVVDDGGHLLGFTRMDRATPANGEIAIAKAHTAAYSRKPSKAWEDRLTAGRLGMLNMPVLPVQGGLPIMIEGECAGGIGVSGVQSHEDEQIAQAAVEALVAALS